MPHRHETWLAEQNDNLNDDESNAIKLNGTLPAFRSRVDRNADTTLKAINHHGLTPASLNRRQPTVNAGKANIDHA